MGRYQNVEIINNCKVRYRPDHIYITQKILDKISDKCLLGLGSINFYDDENDPVIKYVKGKYLSKPSRIDVFMGSIATSKKYSLMHFNILINNAIVDHIVKYLQPNSQDKEILAYKKSFYNPNWLYLGIWSPMLIPINFLRFLFTRVSFFQSFVRNQINRFLDKQGKDIT